MMVKSPAFIAHLIKAAMEDTGNGLTADGVDSAMKTGTWSVCDHGDGLYGLTAELVLQNPHTMDFEPVTITFRYIAGSAQVHWESGCYVGTTRHVNIYTPSEDFTNDVWKSRNLLLDWGHQYERATRPTDYIQTTCKKPRVRVKAKSREMWTINWSEKNAESILNYTAPTIKMLGVAGWN